MPRINSTWIIGSIESLPLQQFTISGIASEVEAGSYYLWADDNDLSLLDQVRQAMVDTLIIPGSAAVILENRRVRISAAANFSINWGTATQLRDLLGFTANLSGASSYIASNISPLLWSGGLVNKSTPTNIDGYEVEDAEIHVSADGSQQITTHFVTHYWDEWEWPRVHSSRYSSTSDLGGTWVTFRREVVVPGYRMHLYEIVEEDTTSTDPVSLPAPNGVYRMREIPSGKGERASGFEHTNSYWKVAMAVRITPEYS